MHNAKVRGEGSDESASRVVDSWLTIPESKVHDVLRQALLRIFEASVGLSYEAGNAE
jgi:hypothetical protein